MTCGPMSAHKSAHMSVSRRGTKRNMCAQIRFDSGPHHLEDVENGKCYLDSRPKLPDWFHNATASAVCGPLESSRAGTT
jgi:hypothetical protein